jgi:hypothetical protein
LRSRREYLITFGGCVADETNRERSTLPDHALDDARLARRALQMVVHVALIAEYGLSPSPRQLGKLAYIGRISR